MKIGFLVLLGAAPILLAFMFVRKSESEATLLLKNGNIYTVNDRLPTADNHQWRNRI